MTLREWFGRLAAWRRRRELDEALDAELEAHLALVQRDLEAQGMDAAAARASARRQLGNLTAIREESREAWGFPALNVLLQDLGYAMRGLRRAPGFTAAAVLTLALGIGANAAMFGVLDRLLLRPFPYLRDPATVNRVYLETTYQGRTNANVSFPYARYLDLARESGGFAQVAAMSEWRLGVGGAGEDAQVRKVAGVSASFFGFFDAPPALGRYFLAEEDSLPLGRHVAVLSHGFWRDAFGGADVIGRPLKIGRFVHTIVGVAPAGFVGTVTRRVPDLFVPITTIPANLGENANYHAAYNWDWTEMLVRRPSGVSEEAAGAMLTHAYIRSRANARAINPRVLLDSLVRPRAIAGAVRTAAGPNPGPETRVLLWVTGVAAVVLLIACASVAKLMLARVIRRRKEIAVRLALGVSRARLMTQFLTEGALLATLGAATGLVVAQWSGSAVRGLLLPGEPPYQLLADARAIGIALGCALACTLLTTLAPAFLATRADLSATLRAGGRDGGRRRSPLQAALLVLQVSLSAILLVGAALFVRSFGNARAVPLGYDARPVLEVVTDFRGLDRDSVRGPIARRRILEEAQALPGVASATVINSGLFRTNTANLRVPGIDSVEALGRFNFQLVSPDYFRVMATPIVRGRSLEPGDRLGAPTVTVMSRAMARALWPGQDPIGQCIRVGFASQDPAALACTTVVGVAEDIAHQDLAEDPRFLYYLPAAQFAPGGLGTMLLRMQVADAETEVERVRRALTRAMPGDGFVFVRPLQEVVDDRSRSWRLGATLFLALGGLAFVVAVIGLYGLISYDVAGRTQELGVRAALGARPLTVVRLVVRQGVMLVLGGVAIGTVASLAAGRWLQPLLFQQSARDPLVLVGVAALMVLVAVAASAVPAVRASRVDPASALRSD